MKHDDAYLRSLAKRGYTLKIGGKGHWKIYDGPRLVTTHAESAGGHRGFKNLQAKIRRYERTEARPSYEGA